MEKHNVEPTQQHNADHRKSSFEQLLRAWDGLPEDHRSIICLIHLLHVFQSNSNVTVTFKICFNSVSPAENGFQNEGGLQVSHSRGCVSSAGWDCGPHYSCRHPEHVEESGVWLRGEHRALWMHV